MNRYLTTVGSAYFIIRQHVQQTVDIECYSSKLGDTLLHTQVEIRFKRHHPSFKKSGVIIKDQRLQYRILFCHCIIRMQQTVS